MSQTEMSPGDRMAAMRTAHAFQRTRMAADRTLMSVQRTSLSLIGFGFTIFSFFRSLADKKLLPEAIPSAAPARFGLTLVALGVCLLALGIASHISYMLQLRRQRAEAGMAEVLPPEPRLPVSLAVVAALTLLLFGIFVILSLMARTGPFGA
jgi:putative membrane protein